MKQILKSYLRKLTNLSGSNRSLLLLRLISDQTIDLHAFDFALNEPSFNLIEKLIARHKEIPVSPVADPRDKDAGVMSQRLRKLQRMEKFIYDERGSHDLYVGWPMVWGKLNDGTTVRCPLIFFPVELDQNKNSWVLKLRQDIEVGFNKSFLLAYSFFNNIRLDEDLFEYTLEEAEEDSTLFRTQIYQLFKESSIQINFNQDNFINKLQPFCNFRKAEFEEKLHDGNLKLYPEAVLGIFPQAGSYLVPDYLKMIDRSSFKNLDDFFNSKTSDITRGNDFFNDFSQVIKEEQIITAFRQDAYQEDALKTIRRGISVVIQGPPGTGKTQLIGNLVSDYIARGKRILVVSQKKAALEVLAKRFNDLDLTPFLGIVHDFKDDRRQLFDHIRTQIERIPEYKLINNNLDSVYLERRFLQFCRQMDQYHEQLTEFRMALYDTNECGLSVKELYLTSDPSAPFLNLKTQYSNFHFDRIEDFNQLIRRYFTLARKFKQEDYPWYNRRDFSTYTTQQLLDIQSTLREIPAYFSGLSKKVKSILDQELTPEELNYLGTRSSHILSVSDSLSKHNVFTYLKNMMLHTDVETSDLWLGTTERVIISCFDKETPETSLETHELGQIQKVLHHALERVQSPLRWLRWLLLTKEKDILRRVLEQNGLKLNRKDIYRLSERIDNRLNLEHNLSKLRDKSWLTNVPDYKTKLSDIQHWFFDHLTAIRIKKKILEVRNLKNYLPFAKYEEVEYLKALKKLHKEVSEIPNAIEKWHKFMSGAMLTAAISGKYEIDALIQVLTNDFDELVAYDKIKNELLENELKILHMLEEATLSNSPDDAVRLFENSIRLAWISHIETKYPVLTMAANDELSRIQTDYQHAYEEKVAVSNDILKLKLRENTYRNIVVNRLNNPITYRELLHQVSKKRKLWPIRKLLDVCKDEVFDLVPAWFCSPESVSAIFSIDIKFDLVLFDEASQCFAERGIPALYRGAQVVVAGDSKQLSPNDLYRVRWEDEHEEEVALEIESLLDLSSNFLPAKQLNGHYRSQNFDLIDFSNRHFYNKKLTLLPEKGVFNARKPSIIYDKVNGKWENNSNLVEAKRIAYWVEERIADFESIGIVTFNIHQQSLIQDILDEKVKEGLKLPEAFFVKNIENVQGDECELLIFSIGYAPGLKGSVDARFGSLNTKGGENRLNVAVTRARKKIIVVCSIYPDELKVENTRNLGPKLLKEYLEYAREVYEGRFEPSTYLATQSSPDWYLKSKLAAFQKEIKGYYPYAFSTELPSVDLSVVQDNQHRGLIITDDDFYFQTPTLSDPHVYMPMQFQEKNWPFLHVFSREYWIKRGQLKERVSAYINKITEEPD